MFIAGLLNINFILTATIDLFKFEVLFLEVICSYNMHMYLLIVAILSQVKLFGVSHVQCRTADGCAVSLVNFPDNNGWTPLHYACYDNNKELVQQLLKAKPDLYAR